MKKFHLATLAIVTGISGILCSGAHAAPGEYWEITTKMEMPGMPFAMPGTTQKTCIQKGRENDPSSTTGDKKCQVTDVKTVGNKTSWKMRCDQDGEVMTGVGEQSTTADGYEGKMQFSGKADGEDMDMTMSVRGKRVGGSCDTDEMLKKIQGQACDTSHLDSTSAWIMSAPNYLQKDSLCSDKKEELCRRVRKDAPVDPDAYGSLVLADTSMNANIAQACGIDMAATTAAICKTLNGHNIDQLSAHCPAQAKAYREEERRKACEGRKYTATDKTEAIRKCMSGELPAGNPQGDGTPSGTPTPAPSDNPAEELLDTAKKLKGMFGL